MKQASTIKHLFSALLSVIICLSCKHDFILPDSELSDPFENGNGVLFCSTPEFDVELTRALESNTIQEGLTEQGVFVKISERIWAGDSIKNNAQTKATWNDVVWSKDTANIGLFTVKSSAVDAYLSDDNPNHIVCFPFGTTSASSVWVTQYYTPSGNNSPSNPYHYSNANLKVDADTTRLSARFFEHANNEELNFYGYYPYQHQTAGILSTTQPTSICKVLQANQHADNLLAMPYTFASSQTKGNIYMHDVMYSVSEDAHDDTRPGNLAHERNRYGNRYKAQRGGVYDNVHMRFIHSFCRLQFTISAGSYRPGGTGDIKLSKLYITGSKVFVDGNLNLIKRTVTPGSASTIVRTLDSGQQQTQGDETYVNLRGQDLVISMIVQPTDIIETLEDFKIVCVVDGVEYICSLSPGIELVNNHVYDVNLVLSPETTVIVSSSGGATASIYQTGISSAMGTLNATGSINATWANYIIVKPNNGWRLFKVIENGALQNISTYAYNSGLNQYTIPIDRVPNETKKYEIVCIPNDWYAEPEHLTMHLDGKLNSGFAEASDFTQQILPVWKDLTYNGNDGILYNFDLTKYCINENDQENTMPANTVGGLIMTDKSGWDRKGLKFDGKDDFVAFPGKINKKDSGSEYTISVYWCVAQGLQGEYHRIISSGDDTPRGFPSLVFTSRTTNIITFCHDRDGASFTHSNTNERDLYLGKTRGVDIVQLDYVYSQALGRLTLYVDGEYRGYINVGTNYKSVPWAALGGRQSDVSRQTQATYYNVMIYDKALTATDIQDNYKLNVKRYGTRKTDVTGIDTDTEILVSSGGGSSIKAYRGSAFNGSNGTEILSPSYTINGYDNNKVLKSIEWLVVEPHAGWRVFKILKNGVPINLLTDTQPLSGGALYMHTDQGKIYNVICIPTLWYAAPDDLSMHLDGRLNQGFRGDEVSTVTNVLGTTWRDISYNGNDGVLFNIATAASKYVLNDETSAPVGTRSGWDGKGLVCDGLNDRVDFPGKINSSAYTVSVYACIEAIQPASTWSRIVSSGVNNATSFPALVLEQNPAQYTLRMYGHGIDAIWNITSGSSIVGPNNAPPYAYPSSGSKAAGVDLVQIDYVYSSGSTSLYIDGVLKVTRSVTGSVNTVNWASLGGRLSATDRQCHITYYNVMVYNKVLTPTEISANHALNVSRYGTQKVTP